MLACALRRFVIAAAVVLVPALATGQSMLVVPAAPVAASISAPLKSDGTVRYALGAGGLYASGTTATLASANVGGEGAVATVDTRWRFGVRALWSRASTESATAASTTLLLTEESQHRWRGSTWFRQKLSFFPAVRGGDTAHGLLDTGVAIAMSPLWSLSLGVTHRFDTLAGLKPADTAVVTALALKLH
jgi:hypothetical protein